MIMISINDTLNKIREKGKKAFVAYITAGDPNLNKTVELVETISEAGADIIELGVPFSDPLADGPTNQKASERALKQGCHLGGVLESVSKIRKKGIETPIVLFSYMNPLFRFGFGELSRRCQEVGVNGLLPVDLTPESFLEEERHFKNALEKERIEPIFLMAPTTKTSRWKLIEKETKGFIYYVSRTGTTGVSEKLSEGLLGKLKEVRKVVKKPLIVGFGLSKSEQVKTLAPYCDGIVVGSAIVREIETAKNFKEARNNTYSLVTKLKESLI